MNLNWLWNTIFWFLSPSQKLDWIVNTRCQDPANCWICDGSNL